MTETISNPDQRATLYYVALHNGPRTALIAGPYTDEADAIAVKEKVHEMAIARDPWAHFYDISLARSPEELKTVFGVVGRPASGRSR
jgi:hypothetical protein